MSRLCLNDCYQLNCMRRCSSFASVRCAKLDDCLHWCTVCRSVPEVRVWIWVAACKKTAGHLLCAVESVGVALQL